MPNVAVIYYSSTGTNAAVAEAVAEGAKAAGAEVRVRLVPEFAPDAAIDSNPKWRAFVDSKKGEPRASLDDLDWADAIVFGKTNLDEFTWAGGEVNDTFATVASVGLGASF